jgi:prephenate dehydratase/prephenate dehydrogenase
MRVAFQGEHGAYSELAAIKYFGTGAITIPRKTFTEVFESVSKGEADYGIVPIENSLEGSVGQNYDLLMGSKLKIVGETKLRVEHCLIGFPGTDITKIRTVYSHPQALGQCRAFLESMRLKQIPVYDTAGSVKMVKESGKKDSAGIASELAARIYGMKVLKKSIESNKKNFTRFFILSKEGSRKPGRYKTSIIFMVPHKPGSLYSILKVFATRKINLTKLESRPIPGRPWEYSFYLDFEGNAKDRKIQDAIEELKRFSTLVKILGSYPEAGPEPKAAPSARLKAKSVAIIGAYGNMGKWFCKFFIDEGFEVTASGRRAEKLKELGKELHVRIAPSSAEAVRNADIVIVSVLMKNFEDVIKQIAPHIKRGQILIDLTSAKEEPVRIMHKYVRNAIILGTHPLFGPGASDTCQNFVLTPTTKAESKFAKIFGGWLESKGFNVAVMSPRKHDEAMSVALCLSHFIGMAAGETWADLVTVSEFEKIAPTSFTRLFGLVENIISSDPGFYANLQVILPGVNKAEELFVQNAKRLQDVVKRKDEDGFARAMIDLKARMEDNASKNKNKTKRD